MKDHPRRIALAFLLSAIVGSAAGFAFRSRRPDLPLALTAGPATIVTVTGGAPAKVQWGVTPAPLRQTPVGQSLVIEGPAGTTYQVTAAVLMNGDVGLLTSSVTICPTLPAPGPVPGPLPGPGPAPVGPVPAQKVWALAVFDTSQQISLPPGQLALYKSQSVVAALAPLGVVYRHYDVNDPAVTGSVWGIAAVRLQKPALVLWTNKAIMPGFPVNLPGNEHDLVEFVTKAVQP
jgi:hypothetical protein